MQDNRFVKITDQAVLFSWGKNHGRGEIIGTKGDATATDAEDGSCMADLLNSEDTQKLPPGIYVWEGEISGDTGGWNGPDIADPDVQYHGTIRPATVKDFADFGISLFAMHNEQR